jgi:hypothetical protein
MTTPNPTNAGMLIEYAMPKAGSVQLDVFDLGGHRVPRAGERSGQVRE